MAGRFSYASAVKGSINTYKDLVIDMKDSYKYGWELERSVGKELEALIEERKLPFKLDKLTKGNGSCWMISVFQQCKRTEIWLYLADDIRTLVENMDTDGLRNAVANLMLSSNHPKIRTYKERYERNDGSEVSWNALWNMMRNPSKWADQNFMQGTAWLLGVDIKILNSKSINGIINFNHFSGNLEEEDVPSIVPPMTIGYRTRCHFQSILPNDIHDGGASQIREINNKYQSNETIDITDDEEDNKKDRSDDLKIDDDFKEANISISSEEIERESDDMKISPFKRNLVIVNEDKNELLGRKVKIQVNHNKVEEIKDEMPRKRYKKFNGENKESEFRIKETDNDKDESIQSVKRSLSNESIKSSSSFKSCKRNKSDFINMNALFGKSPLKKKGNN